VSKAAGCGKGGAKFVLYSGSKAYDLVPVTFLPSALDAGTNTIHVQDIKR
jgi:hypothetical protein